MASPHAGAFDEDELADWRAGRDAVYQLAALIVGARLAVADAQQCAKGKPRRGNTGVFKLGDRHGGFRSSTRHQTASINDRPSYILVVYETSVRGEDGLTCGYRCEHAWSRFTAGISWRPKCAARCPTPNPLANKLLAVQAFDLAPRPRLPGA